MPYTVKTDGSIGVDTPEEAIALRKAILAEGTATPKERRPQTRGAVEADIEALRPFFGLLRPKERQILELRAQGKTHLEIAAAIGWTSSSIYTAIWSSRNRMRLAAAAPNAPRTMPTPVPAPARPVLTLVPPTVGGGQGGNTKISSEAIANDLRAHQHLFGHLTAYQRELAEARIAGKQSVEIARERNLGINSVSVMLWRARGKLQRLAAAGAVALPVAAVAPEAEPPAPHARVKGPSSELTARLEQLRPWFDCLSEKGRALIDRRVAGASPAEIAAAMGIKPDSVSNRLCQLRYDLERFRDKYPDPALAAAAHAKESALARANGRLAPVRTQRVRAKTIAIDVELAPQETVGDDLGYPEDVDRPRTRGDCASMSRPCPFVSCAHHLYLDVNRETGTVKLNFPNLEVWELRETCSLDVADRGGVTLEEVGSIMNLTRERIRQIEVFGMARMKKHEDKLERAEQAAYDTGGYVAPFSGAE
jgi:DNA-binding CsgD family transcriptional regulator